jgi:D-alanyl-D-alanine carboxypeptidase
MNAFVRRLVPIAGILSAALAAAPWFGAPVAACAAAPSSAGPAGKPPGGDTNATRIEHAAPEFPDTHEGRAARAWFKAFNGTEEDMRAMWRDYFAPMPRPIEQRLERWRDMRDQAGSLTPVRVRPSPRGIEVVARDAHGQRVRVGFEFDEQAPHGIVGVRLEPADEDGEEGSGPSTPLTETQAIDTIGAHVDSLTRTGRFSGVVRIERGGQAVFERAYGFADREAKIANAADTKFNIGSINKMFTKAVIVKLIEEGKLAPDDKLSKHLPDFPRDKGDKITIQQLLDMKSGMGDFFGPKYDAADKSKLMNPRDWFPLFQDDPLHFEPGTASRYSNAGYDVLGAVAEAVTKKSYYDLVRDIVYRPAGMTASESYGRDEAVPNRARGYTRRTGSGVQRNDDMLPGRGSPAGGGYSTTADLSRFMDALLAGKIVGPAMVEKFFGARSRPDGALELAVGFAGGSDGVNALVMNEPDTRIIVLANLDPPAAERLGTWIKRTMGRVRS